MTDKDVKLVSTEELAEMDAQTQYLSPIFGSYASDVEMPVDKLNHDPIEPRIASEIIREYIGTEGNAHQNLCTFVQTYMEPEAAELMKETLEKNAIDKDEYPMTADLENRCVKIIQNLWHANPDEEPMGTSTVGSSEACMLGGLAALFRWKALAKAAGIDIYSSHRPNLVITSGYQVCWEKFCRYWDIEMRLVPMEADHLYMTAEDAMKYVDDHTICVVCLLGITYTGRYDDVKGVDAALTEYNKTAKVPVRIHVDGASGAMVAPFIEPDLDWDFKLPNVWSISTSGHKYGLVYPGIGWVCWRSKEALPEDLIFWVSYLGGQEATMAINFSRVTASRVTKRSRCAPWMLPITWFRASRNWVSSSCMKRQPKYRSCAGASILRRARSGRSTIWMIVCVCMAGRSLPIRCLRTWSMSPASVS